MLNDIVVELLEKKEKIQLGNNEKIEKQHQKGKLTARERIYVLLDKNSFQEFGIFVKHRSNNFGLDKVDIPCDGVVCGCGTIFGRPVYVYSQDFTASGGSLGEMQAKKITSVQKKALESKIPIIGINDSISENFLLDSII